ncbi:MAG: DUF4115 domain-containing protein [Woeseia sp.]
MSEELQPSADESATGPVAGERLAEARRLKKISLPDIARELHIDESKVQALEENRFEVLGAPVFAKGHLRKYAEIVGVPIDDVIADYYLLNKATGAPPIVGRPRKQQRDLNLLPWLLLIPVLLILGGGYYWWQNRPASAPSPTLAPASSQGRSTVSLPTREPTVPAESAESAAETTPVLAVPAEAEVEQDDALAVSSPLAENAARVAPAVLASGELALQLQFSGDCWTEVTDSDGERLFFDLGKTGRTVNLRGSAPVRVLLGNSNNVSIRVNGEPYTIAAADRRGDTARMSINR